jgi:hypothetical protein
MSVNDYDADLYHAIADLVAEGALGELTPAHGTHRDPAVEAQNRHLTGRPSARAHKRART